MQTLLKILDADEEEVPLESIGDDALETPNIVSSSDDEITASDVGETVQTDDIMDSFTEEIFDEEPDDAELFAAEAGGGFLDDIDF